MRPYIHHVQGRLRIRCPRLKRNQAQADEVQKILESRGGIRACEINVLTGSVLIRYDAAFTSAPGIVEYLQGLGYVSDNAEPTSIAAPRRSWAPELGIGKKRLAGALMNAVFEQFVERSAVALIRAVL
ncbi:MAG: HMA2 domain-containing protein [Gammaproteobacteria bacterium]